jgi:hypothetical protein
MILPDHKGTTVELISANLNQAVEWGGETGRSVPLMVIFGFLK